MPKQPASPARCPVLSPLVTAISKASPMILRQGSSGHSNTGRQAGMN